jgi:hypothetical protein
MANIQEKTASLFSELEATVEKYNQALGIVNSTKEQIISLQGALTALRELAEEDNLEAANAIVDASCSVKSNL